MTDHVPILEVNRVGKKFARDIARSRRLGATDILSEFRLRDHSHKRGTTRRGEFWALEDVTFAVPPGEALGIIGHNGAGKSTLLRILHGLIRPDTGEVVLRGRQAALLDLGAPFNRILSGRENIATAAAAHGIHRGDAADLIEAVGDFAEMTDVLDAPMWTYSSGMQMRLGYGIAAQLSPDLFLVDEVIAVGDIGFQRKCVAHIRKHLSGGGSLVLVSHDLWMVQALCSRCLVLSNGRIIEEDSPNQAISTYLRELRQGQLFANRMHNGHHPDEDADPGTRVYVETVVCSGADGRPPSTGGALIIEVTVRSEEEPRDVRWHVDLLMPNMQACIARLQPPDRPSLRVTPDGVVLTCTIPRLPLFPGTFYAAVHITDPLTDEEIGVSGDPIAIDVEGQSTRLETLAQIAGTLSSIEGTFGPQLAINPADRDPARR